MNRSLIARGSGLHTLVSSAIAFTAMAMVFDAAHAQTSLPAPSPSPTPVSVNWSQPPVACVEEIVPQKPSRTCLDLTAVADPRIDFPAGMSAADLEYWNSRKTALSYCRSKEILRREAALPGTFTAGTVQVAWMRYVSVNASADKISAVYQASREQKMPAQILAGALMQESLYASMGIAQDGSNYSCGVGQVNLSEWCNWANTQSPEKKAGMNWPSSGLACTDLRASMLKPYYEIAKTRLGTTPEYQMNRSHFDGITLSQVINGLPTGTYALQQLRHQAITSFVYSCSISKNSIPAKANELKRIYMNFVPAGLRQRDLYASGNGYQRTCAQASDQTSYPLSSPWLLAVGIYNAGPDATQALAHYNRWTSTDLGNVSTFTGFTPRNLVEAFYWSGKWNATTDRIEFTRTSGTTVSWPWFKSCILHRHIARVAQHATLASSPRILDSLEAPFGCAPSTVDPATGQVKTSVPPHRQTSTGRKH